MKPKDYGSKVRKTRIEHGYTQTELAEHCHLGLRTIQRIEAGEVVPRLSTRRLINDFLEISNSEVGSLDSKAVNYETIFYLGIAVFGLGIMFSVAVNLFIGISFLIIGLINIFIGWTKSKEKPSTVEFSSASLKEDVTYIKNEITEGTSVMFGFLRKHLKFVALIIGILMLIVVAAKVVVENTFQWLGVLGGVYLIWLYYNYDRISENY